MPTTRDDLRAALSHADPEALRAILVAAGVREGAEDQTASELADRVAKAVWWHATTPLGYASGTATLESIAPDRVVLQHAGQKFALHLHTRAAADAPSADRNPTAPEAGATQVAAIASQARPPSVRLHYVEELFREEFPSL